MKFTVCHKNEKPIFQERVVVVVVVGKRERRNSFELFINYYVVVEMTFTSAFYECMNVAQ
jgi:hypothetical protein